MATSLRIVVTGGSGKIGTRLLEVLIARGHQPIGLDRDNPTPPVAPFVQADLRERAMLEPILEQADAICHLGEYPQLQPDMRADQLFAHNVTVGSRVLQTAADLKLKRIVYVSTCQVYGLWGDHYAKINTPPKLPMDETAARRPQDAYALGKVAVEDYACMLAEQNPGLSIAAIRLPWVMDDREVANARAKLPEILQMRDGMNTYLHLDDAAEVLAMAIEGDGKGFKAYHAVADDIISARPTREILKDRFGEEARLPPDFPDFGSPVTTEKARQHFGWTPRFSIHR